MGFLEILFGRSKPKAASREPLFAIVPAQVTMATRHGIQPEGRAGLCFRPSSSSFFQALDRDIRDLLAISAREAETRVKVEDDPFGYRWAVLEDPDFEDLVTTIHMVTGMAADHGFSDRLLAAAFRFLGDGRTIYWVYNYRRGTFYPFVPLRGQRSRDNQEEIRLSALLERDLPVEKNLDQWYALWDLPV